MSFVVWLGELFLKIRSLAAGEEAAWWAALAALLSAGLTLVGLVVAALAGYAALLLFRVEFKRDKARDEDVEREQADLVSCWFIYGPVEIPPNSTAHRRPWMWCPFILNASRGPIFNLDLNYFWQLRNGDVLEAHVPLRIVPPSPTPTIGVLPEELTSERGGVDYKNQLDNVLSTTSMAIVFTDMKRRRWLRDPSGVLHRIG